MMNQTEVRDDAYDSNRENDDDGSNRGKETMMTNPTITNADHLKGGGGGGGSDL